MAQHDYNLANNTGALYRADNNAALQAIVTQNSGTTQPAVMFPGMLWLDLSGGGNGVLRRRNQANTGWLNDLGIDQTARDAAAAANTNANSRVLRAGDTMTGALNLVTGVPTANNAVSRAAADALYQVVLPATAAGNLLMGTAGGWGSVITPGPASSILTMSGGLPGWQSTSTVASPGVIPRALADGTIDPSFIPAVAAGLRFRGTFKPAVNAEYPTTGGSGAAGVPAVGDFWVIDGLTTGGYTYLNGSLAGVTVFNGDSIAYNGTGNWYRMGNVVNLQGYLKTDGSIAMAGALNMGTYAINNVGGIAGRTGSQVPMTNFRLDGSNIVISPQRGTSGAAMATLAAGQLGTDLGRMQIVTGSGASNTDLLSVPFFSSTETYAANSHVMYNGRIYRAKAIVSPGAFTASQWWQLVDAQSGFVSTLWVQSQLRFPTVRDGTTLGYFTDYTASNELSFNVADDAGVFRAQVFRIERTLGVMSIVTPLNVTTLTATGQMAFRSSPPISFQNAAGAGRYYITYTETDWNFNTMDDSGAYTGTPFRINRTGGIFAYTATLTANAAAGNQVLVLRDSTPVVRFYCTTSLTSFNFNAMSDDAQSFLGTSLSILRNAPGIQVPKLITRTAAAAGEIAFGDSSAFMRLASGNFNFTVACTAPSFTPTSDIRTKHDIVEAQPRAIADDLAFYTYTRNADDVSTRGAIAQDVEEVAPEYIVRYPTEDGERLALDMMGLTFEIAMNLVARVRVLESALIENPADDTEEPTDDQ